MSTKEKALYSLMPLEDFKAVLGVDDREDKLAGYCLVTSTYTIEQHCKRRLLRKKVTDIIFKKTSHRGAGTRRNTAKTSHRAHGDHGG